MSTRGWIEPGSEEDMALHGYKSACDQLLDPKHREAFVAEARLSEVITEVHDMTLQLMSYLTHIENEAQTRATVEELAERIGGFA